MVLAVLVEQGQEHQVVEVVAVMVAALTAEHRVVVGQAQAATILRAMVVVAQMLEVLLVAARVVELQAVQQMPVVMVMTCLVLGVAGVAAAAMGLCLNLA